jgi:formate dehydrogenase major subunit
VPGLGTSYGRGGATTNQTDVRFADSVLIMGSNMAECHPVSFRFLLPAAATAEMDGTYTCLLGSFTE